MPHCYLNIEHVDAVIEDLEGEEFDSIEAARKEAIASAREIMSGRVGRGRPADGSVINVLDSERRSVLRVPFKDAIGEK